MRVDLTIRGQRGSRVKSRVGKIGWIQTGSGVACAVACRLRGAAGRRACAARHVRAVGAFGRRAWPQPQANPDRPAFGAQGAGQPEHRHQALRPLDPVSEGRAMGRPAAADRAGAAGRDIPALGQLRRRRQAGRGAGDRLSGHRRDPLLRGARRRRRTRRGRPVRAHPQRPQRRGARLQELHGDRARFGQRQRRLCRRARQRVRRRPRRRSSAGRIR